MMKKIVFLVLGLTMVTGLAAEDDTPPLRLLAVGLARESRSTKFDSGVVSTQNPKGTISEFSTGDFSIPVTGFFDGQTWGGYLKADVSLQDLLASGSDSVKTTDKATGVTAETNQNSNPLVQYQSTMIGLPFKLQGGVMFTALKYIGVGAGLKLSAIGIKYKDSGNSNYSQVKSGEVSFDLQGLVALPIPHLVTLYFNPSWSIGTVGSADFITKAVWGEGPDLGEGKVICRDLTFMAKLFDHILIFMSWGNETRNFNKKLPTNVGESTITTSYMRFGAGYAF